MVIVIVLVVVVVVVVVVLVVVVVVVIVVVALSIPPSLDIGVLEPHYMQLQLLCAMIWGRTMTDVLVVTIAILRWQNESRECKQ